jgi:L-alanine-DL-glutamate epimerase-like enolase superfamily enzyme
VSGPAGRHDPKVERVEAAAYTVPTEGPEQDGTLDWDATTMLLVEVAAGGEVGYGYSYTAAGAAEVVRSKLAEVVEGSDPMRVGETWAAMTRAVRNLGRSGVAATAIAAVDVALWDLKAKLLDQPLVTTIDPFHDACPIYGSGGFTNYSNDKLAEQLGGWVGEGIPRVKMKVGRDPAADMTSRVPAARAAVGDDVELYVDANGALTRKDALACAEVFAGEYGVRWFEEPVSSDDIDGLRLLRDRGPAGMDIAAGEYGYVLEDFRDWLRAEAVDCLQADVTRCGGITGFLQVGALVAAWDMELSAHCAPAISAQAACGVWKLRHLEYFHDHVLLERMAFDGVLTPEPGGLLRPDRDRPGHGLVPKKADLEKYRVG